MRTLKFVLMKEFRLLLRNRGILRLILIGPAIQMFIMPLVADFTVKNISLAVVDNDHSTYSQKLLNKIVSSGYFNMAGNPKSYRDACKMIEDDRADLVLEIPAGFENNIRRENMQKLFIAINAINGTKANLGGGYLNTIIVDFNSDIRVQWNQEEGLSEASTLDISTINLFNQHLSFQLLMVPGIMVTLLMGAGGIQSALNLVHEKEIGTIEQINVSPIKKYQFILGKLIPFWVLSMIVFTTGLLIARLYYGIVPLGSVWLLYFAAAVFLFAVLGLGLVVSTYNSNQQQAMSVLYFFLMVFNMISGLFTSLDSMPEWAKFLSHLFPVSHFIEIMRMIVIKGSDLKHIMNHILAIFIIGLIANIWAILNYSKTN